MSYDSYQPGPPGTTAYSLPRRNDSWNRERDRDADRGRDRNRGRDSWRPDAPSGGGGGRPPPPPPYNGYGNERDSYRPPLPPPPPPSFGHDNFRPPQSDFHFRVDRPAGIADAPASYRPGPGRSGPRHNHPNNRRDGHAPRRGGPYPRFMASNRPILSGTNKATTQDFVKDEAGVTYIPIDELSDSDEADMDISDDEQDDRGSGGEPSQKRQRLAADTPTSADEAPKWSNPDPYFVLPPTDVQQRKKDVVQLIRKARVQPTKPDAAALGDVEPEEFISFDLDDSGDDEQVNASSKSFPPGAPTAPRGANKLNHENNQNKAAAPSAHLPPTDHLNPSRKRTHNDQLKLELPSHAKLKKVTKMPVGGIISAEWRVVRGQDPCPWFKDHSGTPLLSSRLHREVVDFYEHVKPRDYEQRLRSDLVDKLNRLVRHRFHDAKIYPFGSFMSGLYLPTGDMDLVLCSDAFLKGGRAKYDAKRELFRFRDFLFNNRLASEGEVEVISKARVPIVKYIDKATGLKVDISFENTTGVKAIQTFLDWKEQYPAMPILVTLIKQFLTMRALNEPVNGGIGGFSIICLVVSMFQLMPQVQSRDMIPEHHLGDMLMHFFDLYGKKFNYVTTAIRLNPPGYVPKSMVNSFIYKNPDRLSIIDPNNPANDISGGSSNIAAISRVFSEAYDMLQEQMALAAKHPDRPGTSLLKVVLEGNYESFRLQRDYLRRMYEQIYGADED